jgi:hypothetical protein
MMFNQDTPLKLRLGVKEPFHSDVFIPLPIPSHPSILKLNPSFSIPSNPDFSKADRVNARRQKQPSLSSAYDLMFSLILQHGMPATAASINTKPLSKSATTPHHTTHLCISTDSQVPITPL